MVKDTPVNEGDRGSIPGSKKIPHVGGATKPVRHTNETCPLEPVFHKRSHHIHIHHGILLSH